MYKRDISLFSLAFQNYMDQIQFKICIYFDFNEDNKIFLYIFESVHLFFITFPDVALILTLFVREELCFLVH